MRPRLGLVPWTSPHRRHLLNRIGHPNPAIFPLYPSAPDRSLVLLGLSSLDPGQRPAYFRSARDCRSLRRCPIKVPKLIAVIFLVPGMKAQCAVPIRMPDWPPNCAGTFCGASNSSARAPMADPLARMATDRGRAMRMAGDVTNADAPRPGGHGTGIIAGPKPRFCVLPSGACSTNIAPKLGCLSRCWI
jgi:hypothetical protein